MHWDSVPVMDLSKSRTLGKIPKKPCSRRKTKQRRLYEPPSGNFLKEEPIGRAAQTEAGGWQRCPKSLHCLGREQGPLLVNNGETCRASSCCTRLGPSAPAIFPGPQNSYLMGSDAALIARSWLPAGRLPERM